MDCVYERSVIDFYQILRIFNSFVRVAELSDLELCSRRESVGIYLIEMSHLTPAIAAHVL